MQSVMSTASPGRRRCSFSRHFVTSMPENVGTRGHHRRTTYPSMQLEVSAHMLFSMLSRRHCWPRSTAGFGSQTPAGRQPTFDMLTRTLSGAGPCGLAAPRSAALLLALTLIAALMCACRGDEVAAVASSQAIEQASGKGLHSLCCWYSSCASAPTQ